jgi:molybdenum cofactor synthesis domain-containing protein
MASDREKALLAAHFTQNSPAQIHVITMSDRASTGEYEDRSGPKLEECIEAFLQDTGITANVDRVILSDDADGLKDEILKTKAAGTHVLFTTGGTGVGPRDNTPDVVLPMADKVIPGVMELVRMKYGVNKPCAVLSRTVCATMGEMLIFVLPGSTKGVAEYMGEIVEVLPHLLCVLHQLDVH